MTATQPTIQPHRRTALKAAWTAERDRARTARDEGDDTAEWRHLERAHILSQPMAGAHLVTHAAMFVAAWRRRDRREILGQAVRLLLAVPGSLSGRYPAGNTGGADVSAFRAMPLPDDLRQLLTVEDPR
jgi:phage terminase Nu1 subunit (DNA packaging protein)